MVPLSTIKEFFFDILFPPLCLGCGRTSGRKGQKWLCEACERLIPLHDTFFCSTCEARLPDAKKICHADAPFLLAAATDYKHEPVKRLLWQLKYRKLAVAAEPVAELLSAYRARLNLPLHEYALTPVPLHGKRLRERGFNQAELIARKLSARAPVAVEPFLVRVRHTPPQVEARDRRAREENMRGAFAVRPGATVRGMRIVLFDDVCTTGATLREAARTLKAAGAKTVIGLVVAKAGFR